MATVPQINIWYGDHQHFGRLGTPQRFINILGNVSHSDSLTSLTYTLNSGEDRQLSIGPDDWRLARPGDFNADIPLKDLKEGDNEVRILARTHEGVCAEKTVIAEYTAGRKWPMPYSIDWSTVEKIEDVAQVVDGLWRIEEDGVRTVVHYYDRIIAVGDMGWTDYEVKCPITFYDFNRSPEGPPCYGGVHASIGMRWTGYWEDQHQPFVKWYPLGAAVMYHLDPELKACWWVMMTGAGKHRPRKTQTEGLQPIELGKPYWMKTRVEALNENSSLYSAKLWLFDRPEPTAWELQMERPNEEVKSGSALLCPHNTDVKYGNVEITPLN